MDGHEYLSNIKKELEAGRYQHKKGTKILAAFGYARRRKAALAAINKEMKKLGLKADPPIDENMPLDSSHISFSLAKQTAPPPPLYIPPEEDEVEPEVEAPIPAFKVAELTAANKHVECIKTNEPLAKAYTILLKNKYSQLVVADSDRPRQGDIKGTISFQTMANALIRGQVQSVSDCLDKTTPQVFADEDIDKVVDSLAKHDVVLVIGPDKRLCGIVTAWDLAVEFAELVGPFKWIGEIESRVRECVRGKLGITAIASFLGSTTEAALKKDPELLTLGELVRMVQNPDNWEKLCLPSDRQVFSSVLDEVRELRNRLMHFRDPLNADEKKRLQNYCEMVRKVC